MRTIYRIILSLAFCILYSMNVSASTTLSITELVKHPLNLSIEDLERFQTVRIQLNEVMKDGTYRGAFFYRGVTLRNLLDTAIIEKKVKTFSKNIDMAIKVKNREGNRGWREIYPDTF